MCAMLVHDMKSPLVSIQGFARRLVQKGEKLPEDKHRHYLQIISKEAKKLEELILDILDFSPSQAANLKLHLAPTNLGDELLELSEVFQPRFFQAGVSIKVEINNDLPMIRADAPRLRRVFTNLLDNALRHSESGQEVKVTMGMDGREVRVVVEDQGAGIPAEEISHIFEPFYRGQKDVGYKGYGLGLSGVKVIVESHGGRVLAFQPAGSGVGVFRGFAHGTQGWPGSIIRSPSPCLTPRGEGTNALVL